MQSRWILYGYKMENDIFCIVQPEAEIVRRIFLNYVNGVSLKSIAEVLTAEQVVYLKEKNQWNKNMIARIIENTHYMGDDEYPQIVDKDIFQSALNRKNALGGKREKDSAEIKYLKSVLFCGKCGKPVRRTAKYTSSREKWNCDNHCKTAEFFDDATLFRKIIGTINEVIKDPDMLNTSETTASYAPDLETVRKINEIRYFFDQSDIQFKPIQKAIFDCVQSKFDCCDYDATTFTEPIKKYMATHLPIDCIDVELLDTVAERILINSDGSISIRFINGKEINSEERTDTDYADTSTACQNDN